jgi:hypothetical protein
MHKLSRACSNRGWRLALRQFAPNYLSSRDQEACEAVAYSTQKRFLNQMWEDHADAIQRGNLDDPALIEKLVAEIEQRTPRAG